MTHPVVSVIMPVYNRESTVGRAMASVLSQTFTDFEFIVVDDGSSDGTLTVVQEYAERDSRVKVLALPANGGQGLARALGTDAARGCYLAVMDSDDVAHPQRLARQVAFMEANPGVTLAGTHARKVMPSQTLDMPMPVDDGELKARLLLVDAAFVHPSVIMRRDFLREHNLNYEAQRRGDDDYAFYNRLVEAGATFANIPETLLDYHRHAGNVSANTPRLEQDKTPLRRFLLGLYYPDLTGREVSALATIMQHSRPLSGKQAFAGLLAAEKAMTMMHSQHGEDHRVLNAILQRYVERLHRALQNTGASA